MRRMKLAAHGEKTAADRRLTWPELTLIFFILPLGAVVIQLSGLWYEPCLRGTDAYYYALQADSWHQTGQVRIPDSSPLHPLTGLLMRTGIDAGQAVKIWLGLSLVLFCAAFYGLCLRRSLRPTMFLGAFLWPLLSPSLLFCAIEFPKTFSSTIILNLALAVAGPDLRSVLTMSGLLAIAGFFHKMALVQALATLAGLFFFWRWDQAVLRRFTTLPTWIKAAGTLAVIIVLGISIFFIASSAGLELKRLGGLHLIPGAPALFLEPNLPLAIRIELALAGFLLISLLLKNSCGRRGSFLALCLVAPAFIPAFGPEPFSLGERFGLLLPLLVALAWVFLSPPSRVPAETTRWPLGQLGLAKRITVYAILMATTLAGSLVRLDWSYPARLNPSCLDYAELSAILDELEPPMLIVNRDFHFYYKYHTGREAFSYEPETHWPKDRIWRLIFGVRPTELHAYLPPECGWSNSLVRLIPGTPYSLIREDCYVPFRASVKRPYNPELYDLLWSSVMNPSKPRPAFLYKKHINDEKDEFSALP